MEENQDDRYISIDVYTCMTLKRHPKDSPFVNGMEDALNESINKEDKDDLRDSIDDYINEIETLYYNVPNESTFTYAIKLTNKPEVRTINKIKPYNLFYRTDTDDEVILTDVDKLKEVENREVSYENGYEIVKNHDLDYGIENYSIQPYRYVSYDRIEARDWARDNAYESPEYPSSQVQGTDCANFVSKAINAGGIPQDRSGKWYRASTWGGWPGDHWFRTGYNGRTGVVIYMKDKGYFYKESNENRIFAGSIMYWNNKSHVALVTYGDGSTIKYTQHGAKQTKDTVYRTENATFYMPSSSILN